MHIYQTNHRHFFWHCEGDCFLVIINEKAWIKGQIKMKHDACMKQLIGARGWARVDWYASEDGSYE